MAITSICPCFTRFRSAHRYLTDAMEGMRDDKQLQKYVARAEAKLGAIFKHKFSAQQDIIADYF